MKARNKNEPYNCVLHLSKTTPVVVNMKKKIPTANLFAN